MGKLHVLFTKTTPYSIMGGGVQGLSLMEAIKKLYFRNVLVLSFFLLTHIGLNFNENLDLLYPPTHTRKKIGLIRLNKKKVLKIISYFASTPCKIIHILFNKGNTLDWR